MRYNANKIVSAGPKGIVISYNDAKKRQHIEYVQSVQLNGTTKYQKLVVEEPLTEKQHMLLERVMYGFAAYPYEKVEKMSYTKKSKITMAYKKAQKVIDKLKQDVMNKSIDSFLDKLFPHSPIVKQMKEFNGYDASIDMSEFSFRELGISLKQIATSLVEARLLPQTFFNT